MFVYEFRYYYSIYKNQCIYIILFKRYFETRDNIDYELILSQSKEIHVKIKFYLFVYFEPSPDYRQGKLPPLCFKGTFRFKCKLNETENTSRRK